MIHNETEEEWHRRERRRVLTGIEMQRYKGEPMRQALTRYVGNLERDADVKAAALKWAHGFLSNTDKAAADRLLELANMQNYSARWLKP